MCFTKETDIPTVEDNLKVAEEDIIVFKMLEERKNFRQQGDEVVDVFELRSPYFERVWTKGETLASDIEGEIHGESISIEKGVHAYRTEQIALSRAKNGELWFDGKLIVTKMIVPKGSKYCENDEEIVSNALHFPNE